MWVTRLSIVDWVYSKTQTLLATLRFQIQPRKRSLVYLWKPNICPSSVGCARSKPLSYSSTESEIVSLDAGLRMEVIPALSIFWDVVIEVLRSANDTARQSKLAQGNLCATGDHSVIKHKTNTPTEKRKREVEQLSAVNYVHTSTHSSQGESQLYIFEDNEAVIKMIIKGRSPTVRRVCRTHRVALDGLFEQNRLGTVDPNQICGHQKNKLLTF